MVSGPKSNLSEDDPLQLFVKKTLNFLANYKAYFISSFIAILLLIIGIFLYLQNQQKLLVTSKKNLMLANKKLNEKKYEESRKLFLDVINISPDINIKNRAKLSLSNVYKSQKKYNDSIEVLNSALKDISENIEGKNAIEYELVYRALISIHMKTKDCHNISKLLSKDFKITKKDDLLLELGRCYEQKGNTKESLKVFKELMQKYPKSPFVTNRIKILNSSGKI